MSERPVALALDIGGTKLSAALVRGGEVLVSEEVPTPATLGPEAVVSEAVAVANAVRSSAPLTPEALGVACAGVVRGSHVYAMSPDLMPGWHDYPLGTRLEELTGLPVTAANDAQAAAYGEWCHGAGAGRDSLLFVTVSTGVGGGLVLGGRLWRGANGLAGHVGHMAGGAVERLASGTALARRAAEAGHAGLGARQVIDEAAQGRAWALLIVGEAVAALVGALSDVKLLADPEVVVLGGSVGLNDGFRSALQNAIADTPESSRVELLKAELGANAGLVGAAALALEG